MERLLIDYLPPVIRDYLEMQAIMIAEQPEIEQLWSAWDMVYADQFVLEASVTGISRWEQMLGITPMGTDTLEDRRFRVLSRLNDQLPYTYRALESMLKALCGEDQVSVEVNHAEYAVHVVVEMTSRSNVNDVHELLQRVVPANMTIYLSLRYNTHAMLARFTHAELTPYTHAQLREDESFAE